MDSGSPAKIDGAVGQVVVSARTVRQIAHGMQSCEVSTAYGPPTALAHEESTSKR